MKLTLRKLELPNEPRRWEVNGHILSTDGGLYRAMDMALAIGLKQASLDNLPAIQWTYHEDTDTYETEI